MHASLVLLLGLCLCFVNGGEYHFKKNAGEASEFPSFVPPTPQMSAQIEDSAAYFVDFEPATNHKVKAELSLYADSDFEFSFALLSPIECNLKITLFDPTGKKVELKGEKSFYPVGEDKYVNGTVYKFPNPVLGEYKLQMESSKLDKATYNKIMRDPTDAYVLVHNEDTLQEFTYVATEALFTGNQIGVITTASSETSSAEDLKKGLLPAALESSETADMIVSFPNGSRKSFKMNDDGVQGDNIGGDKVFAGRFTAVEAGAYVVQTTIRGTAPNKAKFVRTTEQFVTVINRAATLAGVATSSIDGNRLTARIYANQGAAIRQYRGYAEVWGKDADGKDLAVCWIGGMTIAEKDAAGDVYIPLELDLNWISRVNAQGPFTLKNVIISDPDTSIAFDTANEIPLDTADLKSVLSSLSGKLLTSTDDAITDEMRQGPLPAHLANISSVSADAVPLVMVHGYCSSVNPWEASSSYFTNAKYFLNADANLSNEEFSRRVLDWIKAQGITAFSYVGHSQGGCVAAHILQFYFSGMDLASGGATAQTLGTPWQGSSGAGLGAALAAVFGTGCGTNNDLTTKGAAAWLTGITPTTQAKITAYTTSAKSCNSITNFILSGDNDGFVEDKYTQLPYGKNMPKVVPWCHSVGMTSPAQTTDPIRNTQINQNAARSLKSL